MMRTHNASVREFNTTRTRRPYIRPGIRTDKAKIKWEFEIPKFWNTDHKQSLIHD